MRRVYRFLAYVIAAEVVVQAMAMVYGIAGLGKWIAAGGVFDKATQESDDFAFPEVLGFAVHGINGSLVIPVLALALLVCSFFAKVSKSVRWAALVLVLVVVQINLGFAGPGLPALGALHGLNALALFSAAVYTGWRARSSAANEADAAEQAVGASATRV